MGYHSDQVRIRSHVKSYRDFKATQWLYGDISSYSVGRPIETKRARSKKVKRVVYSPAVVHIENISPVTDFIFKSMSKGV